MTLYIKWDETMTQNNAPDHNMTINELPANPYDLFAEWFRMAGEKEPNDPNAMCLATVGASGKPSARMVLLKGLEKDRGFIFYTNAESRKGGELSANPDVAVCFHWKSLLRQIRIEGRVVQVGAEQADAYYNSRERGSRVGAWASRQSRPLESYAALKEHVESREAEFEGKDTFPRPPYWNGYCIEPRRIEFWIDGQYRLHQRYVYEKQMGGSWTIGMLYP